MGAMSVVLVDDPAANRQFDLGCTLERRGAWRLGARVVPGEIAAADAMAEDVAAIAAASAITAGAPVPLRNYRIGDPGPTLGPGLALGPALDELVRRVPPPFAVIVFVSLATLPFVEALHLDPRSRPLLKIGVTSPRLDPAFTLAQKLFADGKLQHHEHTPALERVLGRRLESMLAAHRAAGAPPVR